MDVSCFCHQMNQMDLIIFFANGFQELHEFIFFLCHQINPMNRMAGAMYCLVHLVCLVIIKQRISRKIICIISVIC